MTVINLQITLDTGEGPLPVSARLFIPGDTIERIVLYLSGASLHADHCATNGSYDDTGKALCRNGSAVLIPDTIGYGAGFGCIMPRYLHRDYAGLDAFYLLRALVQERIHNAAVPVYIYGYSQGAYHAIALLKRLKRTEPLCCPRLFVGGGIYDLRAQFAAMLQRRSYPVHPPMSFTSSARF